MLIDQAKIYVTAGKGGDGCNSLYKDIFHRKGIPDGGDGGSGGDVIFKSDTNLNTLLDFKYNQHYRADNGRNGGSNRKHGKRGDDRLVKVPVGTIIRDAETDLVIRDLSAPDEKVVVARGGEGGKGSAKLAEPTRGEEGESRTLFLELKLIADAGIIGLPNAGKSTIVSRISKAHTKIAPYPFTTKSPKLGMVSMDEDSFVVADMPGLIEGAHQGRGLGDRFLRHIERTCVLVHVIDMAPLDGSDPADNFFNLEKELKLYGQEVYGKPRLIAANKMDMPGAGENLEKFTECVKSKVWPVSALSGQGIKELIAAIYKKVKDVKEEGEEDNGKDRDQGPDRQEQQN
ncbi:MAG: GTPase ObgE [Candidatus Omnitrophica bacterium]|nr:GTPase ObgE [Candidatus Omnitrophota bacterium]